MSQLEPIGAAVPTIPATATTADNKPLYLTYKPAITKLMALKLLGRYLSYTPPGNHAALVTTWTSPDDITGVILQELEDRGLKGPDGQYGCFGDVASQLRELVNQHWEAVPRDAFNQPVEPGDQELAIAKAEMNRCPHLAAAIRELSTAFLTDKGDFMACMEGFSILAGDV